MSTVKICHARGGDPTYTPGDQTGREVCAGVWYDGGWTLLLRPKSRAVAEAIAASAEAGAANEHIGYSQADRNSARARAKARGMLLGAIDTPCNVDCSSFASLCAECAGGIGDAAYSYGNAPWTGNMREKFTASGNFEALTDTKYLKSPDYLLRGDILVNEPQATGHTVVVCSDGALANAPASAEAAAQHPNGVELNGERVDPWTAAEAVTSFHNEVSGLSSPEGGGKHKTHRVQWGDTLWDIAKAYGTTVEKICELNELNPDKFIYEGQVIVIPK